MGAGALAVCDERFVPPSSADSNYGMARHAFLAHVPAPAANIHPSTPKGSPRRGGARVRSNAKGSLRRADAQHRSSAARYHPARLGSDGHTASLLPGEPILSEYTRWVAPVPHGRPEPRISLTYPRSTAAAW